MMNIFNKYRKIIKYGLFGLLTAGIEYVSFWLLEKALPIYVAATVSFLCGLVASFVFNKFAVFKNSKYISKREILSFFCLGLVNSQLSSMITTALAMTVPAMLAKITTMALIATWNYLVMNRLIFRTK